MVRGVRPLAANVCAGVLSKQPQLWVVDLIICFAFPVAIAHKLPLRAHVYQSV